MAIQTDVAAPTAVQPLRRAPVQRRSAARVQRMLDAGQELVAEIGYDAVTTTLIAERANVSIGSLYQFFPDRLAVIRAVALRNLERFEERVSARLTVDAFTDWWDVVSAMLDEYVAMHAEIPGFAVIRFGDVADRHLLDTNSDNDTIVAGRLAEQMIDRGMVDGDTDALRLHLTIAVKIADTLVRMAFARQPSGDPQLLDEAKRIIREHLTRYLGEPNLPDVNLN